MPGLALGSRYCFEVPDGNRSAPASLFDAGRAPAPAAQVVQPRTPHGTLPNDLNRLDGRRVDQERALYTNVVGYAPDGERRSGSASALADDHTLEGLDPLTFALGHPYADPCGVTGPEVFYEGVRLNCDQIVRIHNAHSNRP